MSISNLPVLLLNQKAAAAALGFDQPFFIRLQAENPDLPMIRLPGTRRKRFHIPTVLSWLQAKFGPQLPKRKRGRPRNNPETASAS